MDFLYMAALMGVPRLLRCDYGTENCDLAYIQLFFRRNHNDSRSRLSSFRYGRSTSNQRIEALWSQLLKSCIYWWIDFFQGLMYNDLYDNTSIPERDCLRFCFFHLIQFDLDRFYWEWNTHRIRKSNTANTAGGIPNELYFTPESSGAMAAIPTLFLLAILTDETGQFEV
ncbi:uncharacterized protein LOC135340086, partial [Halichondria panicea]|uniref:uncharacterized protein LOC135340086 n=1 Tax=Halichondria panicea TaxID=6063 RepID=UPI00312B5D2E